MRMISLHKENAFVDEVSGIFGETGLLSKARHFEYRPEQQRMAVEVAKALVERRSLVVEAGTGVGKSLAYLVPALMACHRDDRKAVVSTHTINLQEQLVYKDLPILEKILPFEFEAVLMKGRQNYLCPRRLSRALGHSGDLFTGSQASELGRIAEWAGRTADGSLSDLDIEPDSSVWMQVCSEAHVCTAKSCPPGSGCFYQEMRRRILSADLVVLNHTLFFMMLGSEVDDAEGGAGGGYLFPNDFAILDEAHTVEPIAARQLGLSVSQYGLRFQLQRLYNPKSRKGILAATKSLAAVRQVEGAMKAVDVFFEELGGALAFGKGRECRIRRPDPVPDSVTRELADLQSVVNDSAGDLRDDGMRAELRDLSGRIREAREAIGVFLSQSQDDFVYWAEKSGRAGQYLSLQAAPVEVSSRLRSLLFPEDGTAVLTSATLSVGGEDMRYFRERIGADDVPPVRLGSPFDYARQVRMHLVKSMPEPRSGGYAEALARWILHFTAQSNGRAFVLFTSYSMMQEVEAKVAGKLSRRGMELFVQGKGLPRGRLVEAFRKSGNGVLFGTDSFWGGVDVPGEALGNVIITRLPFAVPDSPMVEAKMETIQSRGGDAFREYSLPEAILKFRQGFGRLIRTRKDKGIVVVLDNRILGKPYGKAFLAALPECPVEVESGEPDE